MGITRYTDTIELAAPTETGLEMGSPSQGQLELINEFRPKGAPRRSAQDYVVVPFLASHNLLNHSRAVWSKDSLKAIAAQFPGKPLLKNHDSDDVDSTVGFIFDSALFQLREAPEAIAMASDHWNVNRSILKRDGFTALVLAAAVPKNSPVVDAIANRQYHQCSTGIWTDGAMICPHCKTDFMDGDNCPHYVPYGMRSREIHRYQQQGVKVADYFIRGEVIKTVELSLVVSGNYPGAAVISEGG